MIDFNLFFFRASCLSLFRLSFSLFCCAALIVASSTIKKTTLAWALLNLNKGAGFKRKEKRGRRKKKLLHSSLLLLLPPNGVLPPLARSPKSVAACFPTTAAL